MEPDNQDLPADAAPTTNNRRTIGLIFLALVVASLIVVLIWQLTKSDDEADTAAAAASSSEVTSAPVVSDSDEVITEIPQEPSLRVLIEEGTTYVENDGNVTMSNIEVSDGAGTVVCDLGTISPGDRQPCEAATGALSPITAKGSGPQDQPVEVTLE